MATQTVIEPNMDEQDLRATFSSLCIKHGIDVKVNPEQYDIKSPCAIDVEHDEQGNLVGIGVYDGSVSLCFTRVSDMLSRVLKNTDLIAHNGKGDFECLRSWGIALDDAQLAWDSMLIGHIIDSSLKSYGLKDMAARELGIVYPSYEDIVGKHKGKTKSAPKCPQIESDCCGRVTLDKQPVEIVSKYNALDTFTTFRLYMKQAARLRSGHATSVSQTYFNDLEKPVSYIFGAMETRGIRLDLPYLSQLKKDLEAKKEPIKANILAELGPINLNSPKQLLGALHAKEIKPAFKGKPSTDKRALESLKNNPTVSSLLAYSEVDTLLSSFITPYLERKTEIVHPFFNQCGTRTGRPSCSNPNLLQIPKKTDNGKLVRRMFVPRSGMLMGDCDFGQIEPRVMAHLSKDPAMCQMFNDGIDFHTFTSERLHISRDRAKVLNLSVGYRATKFSVQRQLGGTHEEAQKQIDAWWSLFPHLRWWQEALIFSAKKSGYCTTLLGRRIKVDGLEGNPWKKESAERQLINNITQGSAAEIMKRAMILLAKDTRLSPQFGLLVQVYDELLAESPDMVNDINIMKNDMVNCIKLDIPLTVDYAIGPNWADVR